MDSSGKRIREGFVNTKDAHLDLAGDSFAQYNQYNATEHFHFKA
jgi:hypothetical protein